MDSLFDILSNKDFTPPDEVGLIKKYVFGKYNQDVNVAINAREIIVSSRSAGLISTLRNNSPALIKAAKTDKKISFRIG